VLFAVIGFMYGGDYAKGFAMPDLRGRVAIGAGTGLMSRAVGEITGSEQVALTSGDKLPTHTHTVRAEYVSYKKAPTAFSSTPTVQAYRGRYHDAASSTAEPLYNPISPPFLTIWHCICWNGWFLART
jgi:microcystin-dependent protein